VTHIVTVTAHAPARANPSAGSVNLVYIRPRQVAFVRTFGRYATAADRAWAVMLEWLDVRGLAIRTPCGFGLAHDNPGTVASQSCRYDACVELPPDFVENLSDGVSFQMLPGGAYARIRHIGPYADVGSAIGVIRDSWLSDQDSLTIDRRRPFLFSFFDDPRATDPASLRCDVCVPVRAPCEDVIPRHRFSIAASMDR